MEKVLVLVATYNGEKYLKEQLKSILSQEKCLVQIVVFDDQSVDKTMLELNYFNNNDNLEVFRNKSSSGSAAQNFLNSLQYINKNKKYNDYSYIALSDQDDIWVRNKLFEGVSKLKEGFNLYMSNLTMLNEKNKSEIPLKKCNWAMKKYDFLFEGGSAGCTYIFDRTTLNLIDGEYEKIKNSLWKFFSHDWFIYFISRLNNLRVFQDKRSFIQYRIHGANVHGSLNLNSFSSIKERVALFRKNWYKEHASGYLMLLNSNSLEYKILNDYRTNYFKRMQVLGRYGYNLMRSKKKFSKFFILNLLKIQ